jgi:hypothetical protein
MIIQIKLTKNISLFCYKMLYLNSEQNMGQYYILDIINKKTIYIATNLNFNKFFLFL